MTVRASVVVAVAGWCLSAGQALAVPQVPPTYTFCEVEDNDLCTNAQVLDASIAVAMGGDESVRDCFYLTGKLQEDCLWDIEPKCAMRVYDKPAPCRTPTGAVIAGSFYEPIIRSSNGEDLTNVAPLSDRTIRLGVAALQDAFDGTINGLSNNGLSYELGEVTVKVFYNGGDGQPRGTTADQEYVHRFGGIRHDFGPGSAIRVAFVIPAGVGSVTIKCCTNTGVVPVCYDVDNYLVTHLIPGMGYCVEVMGGLDMQCEPTDTLVGIFDKNCYLQLLNDDKAANSAPCQDFVYSKICAFAEVDGSLRFAVTGTTDEDFNGLDDSRQQYYFDLLTRIRIVAGLNYTYRPGASTKDESIDLVNRYPRSIWDDPTPQNPGGQNLLTFGGAPEAVVAHGVCGGYCIKIQLADHVDTRPNYASTGVMSGARADMNQDGVINSADLALLLSYWGTVN